MNKNTALVVAAAVTKYYDRVTATSVQMPDSEYYIVKVVNNRWQTVDTFDTTLSVQQVYPTREGWVASMQEVKDRVKERMTHAGTLAYRAFEG